MGEEAREGRASGKEGGLGREEAPGTALVGVVGVEAVVVGG